MKLATLATCMATLWLIVAAGSDVAGAKSSCPTVVVHGTGNNDVARKRASVSVHRCERIKVEFVIPTQNTLVYLWRVTRPPAAKILKLVSHGYGKSTMATSTQIWVYRALKSGKTSVKFGDFTPSYPNAPAADTFTLKADVR